MTESTLNNTCSFKTMWVSPDDARRWLNGSENVRFAKGSSHYKTGYNPSTVAEYRMIMEASKFVANNGETIKLDDKENVIDGFHRLNAVIAYGKPVLMTVAFNCPKDAAQTVDIGMNRKYNCMRGVSALTWNTVKCYFNGATRSIKVPDVIADRLYNDSQQMFTNAVAVVSGGGHKPVARITACAVAAYIMLHEGESYDNLGEFFKIVNTGYVPQGKIADPAITLRNALISKKYKSFNDTDRRTVIDMTVHAYCDYKDQYTRKCKYKQDGTGMNLLAKCRKDDGIEQFIEQQKYCMK